MAARMDFPRIKRLPPYVFNVVGDLKLEARRRGEDIVDFSMGNPDGPTPPHVVASLVESAQKPQNHRYSVSRGIFKLRVAICDWYRRRFAVCDCVALHSTRSDSARPAMAGWPLRFRPPSRHRNAHRARRFRLWQDRPVGRWVYVFCGNDAEP